MKAVSAQAFLNNRLYNLLVVTNVFDVCLWLFGSNKDTFGVLDCRSTEQLNQIGYLRGSHSSYNGNLLPTKMDSNGHKLRRDQLRN